MARQSLESIQFLQIDNCTLRARYVHVVFTLCSRCALINTLLQFQCIARVKHLYLLLGHYYVERAHLNQLIFLPQSEGSELNSAWRIVFNHSSRILSTL